MSKQNDIMIIICQNSHINRLNKFLIYTQYIWSHMQSNLSSQAQVLVQSLLVLSKSEDPTLRRQANEYLVQSSNNVSNLFMKIKQIIYFSLSNLKSTYSEVGWQTIGLLTVCFIRQIFYSNHIKIPFDLCQLFRMLYRDSYNLSQKIRDQVLVCFNCYLNAPGNIRTKKDFITQIFGHVSSKNNILESDVVLAVKVMGDFISNKYKQNIAQVCPPAATYRIIKNQYDKPPPHINNKLWQKFIVSLVAVSKIPAPTNFIIQILIQQLQQNLQNTDIQLYCNALVLYLNGSYGKVNQNNDPGYDYMILKGLINKNITAILNYSHQDIFLIQQIIKSINKSLSDVYHAITQNQQLKYTQFGLQITTNFFCSSIINYLFDLVEYCIQISQDVVLCNQIISMNITEIFEVIIEDLPHKQQVQIFLDLCFATVSMRSQKNLNTIFLNLLPRNLLQMLRINQILYSGINKQDTRLQILTQKQKIQKTLGLLTLVQHYIDVNQLIPDLNLMRNISQFTEFYAYFKLQSIKQVNTIDKVCIAKSVAICILCKMEKYYHKNKDDEKKTIFFARMISQAAQAVKYYGKIEIKNLSNILDKTKDGIQKLIKIQSYQRIIFQQSIQFQKRLLQQLMDNTNDQNYKQKILFLQIQMLRVSNQTLETEYIQTNQIIELFIQYFSPIINNPKYSLSLEQSILELYQKIIYKANLSSVQYLTAIHGFKQDNQIIQQEQLPGNVFMKNIVYDLQKNLSLLSYILSTQRLLNADDQSLTLYTRIILQFSIHKEFNQVIVGHMINLYKQGVKNPNLIDVFKKFNIVWEAIVILYGKYQNFQQLKGMEFYDRIERLMEWDLQKLLSGLDIDPEQKNQYQQQTKKSNEYLYKWSKLPQVRKIIQCGSIVNRIVDKKLAEMFN